jgi:hypothetical protein
MASVWSQRVMSQSSVTLPNTGHVLRLLDVSSNKLARMNCNRGEKDKDIMTHERRIAAILAAKEKRNCIKEFFVIQHKIIHDKKRHKKSENKSATLKFALALLLPSSLYNLFYRKRGLVK